MHPQPIEFQRNKTNTTLNRQQLKVILFLNIAKLFLFLFEKKKKTAFSSLFIPV